MATFILSILVLIFSGFASLLFHRKPWTSGIGAGGALLGSVLGLWPVCRTLGGHPLTGFSMSGSLLLDSVRLGMDPLTAFFLLPVYLLTALAALYGHAYFRRTETRPLGFSWFCYNLLAASMALVLVSRNALLFLFAWEIMAVSSFFLVGFHHDQEQVRKSSAVYLIASTLGTLFLIPMFILLGKSGGSLDFSCFQGMIHGRTATLCFILAVIGFGTKAGIIPFHVWLPEAHPVAPSHVSAVMSGVMIKTGAYGVMRILGFLPEWEAWWGWLLAGLGVLSGIMGVLLALVQHDIKRLLAYHSVENIGIIFMGLGIGVTGAASGSPLLSLIGFSGALFHVFNHALFKGLLFLGAGSVYLAVRERDLDHLGGLFKSMPVTGSAFLVGAAAISGIPPLNGFVSEFLIYTGAFMGVRGLDARSAVICLSVIAGLALVGGLAAACFAKAFGAAFLGIPRRVHGRPVSESPMSMGIPMILLAAGCAAAGIGAPVIFRNILPAAGFHLAVPAEGTAGVEAILTVFSKVFIGLAGLILAFLGVRRLLLRSRKVSRAATWDCGYLNPTARMQYTASSFAQPIAQLFHGVLRTEKHFKIPDAFFPQESRFMTETPDLGKEKIYRPLFEALNRFYSKFRMIQHGRTHLYVLYMVAALVLLLFWHLR